MGSNEKFCLRWNDFESNISVAFRELREEKDFFDVTLACDDSQLEAHKVILSACSPFFRDILKKNPHQHPLLYLKGVKYKELVSVLNFMYMGEVNVAQEELNSFLSVAEELRVKGLTQNNSDSGAKPESKSRVRDPPESAPPTKKSRPTLPPPQPQPTHDDDIQEVIPVKSEPRDQPVPVSQDLNHVYQDTGAQGGTVALQENYPDDYDYDGGYEGYDEGSYDPSALQATGADGNKGREGICSIKTSWLNTQGSGFYPNPNFAHFTENKSVLRFQTAVPKHLSFRTCFRTCFLEIGQYDGTIYIYT